MDIKQRKAMTRFVGLHVPEEVEENLLKFVDLDIDEIEDSYLGKVTMLEDIVVKGSDDEGDIYDDFMKDMELYKGTRSQIDNSLGNIYKILERQGMGLSPGQKVEIECNLDQALKGYEMEVREGKLLKIQNSSSITSATYQADLELEYLDSQGDVYVAPLQVKLKCDIKTIVKKMEMEWVEVLGITLKPTYE